MLVTIDSEHVEAPPMLNPWVLAVSITAKGRVTHGVVVERVGDHARVTTHNNNRSIELTLDREQVEAPKEQLRVIHNAMSTP